MLSNYFKTAFRNLYKNKLFSLINIAGLALGMACCFLVVLFLQHEFSYDTFHENTDRIYRVNYHAGFANNDFTLARIPPPISPMLPDYIPEIEHSARMFGRGISVSIKDNAQSGLEKYEIETLYFSDSTITDILTFDFIQGNPATALDAPFSVVITEELAEQFFGTTDALGKQVHFLDIYPFEVTGVVKSYPANSHLEFDMLAPYANMFDIQSESNREAMRTNLLNNWIISHSFTYVLLGQGQSAERVNEKLVDFIQTYGNEDVRDGQTFTLYPIRDIHLRSQASLEPTATANLRFLYIFLAIGFITLLIACINFINFSTAGSLSRAREVGVRKVLGAGKGSLVGQFLGESMLLSFAAFVLSIGLLNLCLPYLNDLVDRHIEFSPSENLALLAAFLGIFLLAGLLAGSYPAFFVTRFKPVAVLKGSGFQSLPKGSALRKILITTQFVASLVLIAGTLGIFRQLQFLRSQSMGFQTDYMVAVPLFSPDMNSSVFGGVDGNMRQKMNAFEEQLLNNSNIEAVTLSDRRLGFGGTHRNLTTDEINREDNLYLAGMSVDYDFADVYKLEVAAGRGFDRDFGTDHLNAYMINEAAVPALNWESPEDAIGKALNREGKQGQVIGVVKNFHSRSLQSEIEPFIMDVSAAVFTTFTIRVKNQNLPGTISYIQSKWDDFFPQKTFEYTFLNEDIAQFYQSEEQLSKMIGYFAFLAILISCFGLYGLVAYAATQKTKEIGVRKILGASIPSILSMLSREFVFLILIAGLIGLPLAYFWLQNWMQDYPVHAGISWSLFLWPLVFVLGIALLTVSYQTLKAALANPVEALRYE